MTEEEAYETRRGILKSLNDAINQEMTSWRSAAGRCAAVVNAFESHCPFFCFQRFCLSIYIANR